MSFKKKLLDILARRTTGKPKQAQTDQPSSGSLAWRGTYTTWEQAIKNSGGYDQSAILEDVRTATLKVKNGEVAYERDGVLFNEIQYSWPLLSVLLKAALENHGQLNVVDFGGSLGSSYFQNRQMLALGDNLKWYVIEQPHFVNCGNEFIEDEQLKFAHTINELPPEATQQVLILSGVLAYLEEPYTQAASFNKNGFRYIIIDRNAFIRSDEDLITTQLVSENVSYPTWFMNKKRLLDTFSNYELVAEFEDNTTRPVHINGKECYWSGLILKKLR
ncbi:MAG: methyltransferase, TIGR04325 family [Chitinophagaceae bacterium]|nr:MAG: methyltransferase, TIGR04325 family [Chitinophagaceae bacterium]